MTDQDIWFSGPVGDAITLVGQRNCVFLVYIYDDSEKTQTLNATLKDEHVVAAIKEYSVALSMEKSSENATMFGQFCKHPIQSVPIVYFIKQGTIRDFGIETMSSEEVVEKLIYVNEMVTPQPSPVSAQVSEQSATNAPPPVNIPASIPPVSVPSSIPNAQSSSNAEETKAKKEELQKQLENLRKERAERDKQDAKEREIKRRQEAKLLQEAKQDRVDKENKKYFDQIKKERLEDEAHRKKVREQIAKDRAEKIAQRNAEKQRSPEINVASSAEFSTSNANHDYSNLNIRQLDGTNIRSKFEASTTLSTVREWINQNRTDDKRKPFKLSSQFPNRLFTEQDDDTTLTNLNLCPSATIIMKPIKKSSIISNNQDGMISYTFNTIYAFIFALFKLITGMFATLFPTNQPQTQQPQQQQNQQIPQPLFRNLKGGQRLGGESSSSSTTEPTIKKRNPYATRVNTLEEEDEDEKRPTYNGNSVNHE
ncbi:hypothetical protein HPULCUR_011319 [Helicostylum pulchrum]|uniref:UBX domain-containing protein n=1 Tax=Helicostylum pulchrum TaxID=562976 RepID=A0ABP9YGT2_9FUNG